MCCIKFNMTDEMASINFAITIGNPDSQLALFLRKKKKPTFTEYDSLVNLNSVESVKNVSEVLLEPYDLYGNDTNIYTFLQYEIFTPLEFENESYNYFACVAEFGNNTETEIFWEEPDSYNLTEANMTGAWTTNYTFMSYTSSCLFYSDAINSWQIDGCRNPAVVVEPAAVENLLLLRPSAIVNPWQYREPAAVDPNAVMYPAAVVDPVAVDPAAVVEPAAVMDPANVVKPAKLSGNLLLSDPTGVVWTLPAVVDPVAFWTLLLSWTLLLQNLLLSGPAAVRPCCVREPAALRSREIDL
ncbi:uncharacterized protein LOC121863378 [Homarus americanus]|uniref:uncharacterized protein LOC121863378 n=1 Tax=Homarus americanus TaxID=6706 RepID=UPI001C46E087|nr:uncharacterized protein LOC121863378 [Homarus americanus]